MNGPVDGSPEQLPEQAPDEPWRILIVDDDKDFVATLTDLLEPCGYVVREAYTATAARRNADLMDPHVALLDVRLGRSSGLDLIVDLRKTHPDMLCVVMTAYAAMETAIEAIQGGAYDYLRKPLSAPDLLRTLERCFEKLRLTNEKRAAVEALRKSEEQFRTVVSASKDAMIAIEQGGRISVFNGAAEAMFGRTKEEMLGEATWFPLLPEQHRERVRKYVKDYLDGVTPSMLPGKTMQLPALRSDGSTFPIELSLSPGQHADGRFVLVVVRDVTDRKRLEEQLRQAQKMEAVGQLAGGVAHDFNNLLQAILCNTQFAMEDVSPENRCYQDLKEAYDAAQRAAALTTQLLTFSRRRLMQPKNVNMNALIADLIKMLRRVIGEDIELKVIPGADLPIVHVDPGQVEQVLMNLMVNARDAMAEGGTITIETVSVSFDKETYENDQVRHGPYVMVRVTDTGCGMSEKTKNRVFEPFFTTKEAGKGTGLGLATVYGIVRQHDGFIHVTSEVGKGASFEIYFPANESDQEFVEQAPLAPVPGGNETILIAEDDAFVRKVAGRILTRAGYTVLMAVDGEQAVKMFRAQPENIDMVLLDVVMPKLNGPAVYERIMATRPSARVLFSSGYSLNSMAAAAIVEKGMQLLPKPYDPDDLLRRVRQTLDA